MSDNINKILQSSLQRHLNYENVYDVKTRQLLGSSIISTQQNIQKSDLLILHLKHLIILINLKDHIFINQNKH